MKNLLYILAGNTIYALAVTLFILPDGLITGGTTGLALFFYHQFLARSYWVKNLP